MNKLQKILGIGALTFLIGCSAKPQNNNPPQYQTLSGKPISVAESYSHYYGSLSTVIEVEGTKVLATVYSAGNEPNNLKNISEGVALIQSEISDGDNDLITLKGYFSEGRFNVKSLNANGYQIDF